MIHTKTEQRIPDYSNVRNVKYLVNHDGVQEWRTGKIVSTKGKGDRTIVLGIEGVRPNGDKTFDEVFTNDPDLTALPNDPAPQKNYSRFRKLVNRIFQWD